MESSCLNYSPVLKRAPIVFPRQKDNFLKISTFSFPLCKKTEEKMTPLHLNWRNSTTKRSQNLSACRVKSINGTTHEHLENVSVGIGIVSFFKGKNVLITGATGFLGKVLIEKILRMNPDVGKMYVIMKAKDEAAAMDRLINEILNKEIFRSLHAMHGENYEKFMLEKIIPVVGDLTKTNIGIKPEIAEEIAEEVDIIVNSAANTNFHERYDVALDINTIGPLRLMRFAKRMMRLKLFVHVSTTYVNGQRKGVILERAFSLGDTISREMNPSMTSLVLDVEAEIKLAFSSATKESIKNVQKMRDLGLTRSKLYGWQDTYVFTKAMGEMVINSKRGEIPVVIIRPSVIESTIKEPVSGWIEGTRMLDPLVLRYGKGQLTGFPADSNKVIDIVPADMVVNATLAAIAKHGSSTGPGLNIYQVASSNRNPLTFNRLFEMMFQHFNEYPVIDCTGHPVQVQPMRLFFEMSEFLDNILTDIMHRNAQVPGCISSGKITNRLKILCMNWAKQAKYLATIYAPYTFYEGRFDNTNTKELIDEMSDEERHNFYCDVESINWRHYIENVHIPGYRKYVMKEWCAHISTP